MGGNGIRWKGRTHEMGAGSNERKSQDESVGPRSISELPRGHVASGARSGLALQFDRCIERRADTHGLTERAAEMAETIVPYFDGYLGHIVPAC